MQKYIFFFISQKKKMKNLRVSQIFITFVSGKRKMNNRCKKTGYSQPQ